jgi:anti-anti-sigma factor
MEIAVMNQGEVVIVAPHGRIDSNTSREFGDRLLDLIKSGKARVLVDFSQVIYISSAGFRALLVASRNSAEKNGALALCSLSNEVRRLFEIGAFIDDFKIYVSRADGLAGSA